MCLEGLFNIQSPTTANPTWGSSTIVRSAGAGVQDEWKWDSSTFWSVTESVFVCGMRVTVH